MIQLYSKILKNDYDLTNLEFNYRQSPSKHERYGRKEVFSC